MNVLIYIVNPSRYAAARVGRFVASAQYPGKHLYDGRAMTVAEFNNLPADFFDKVDTGGQSIQIKILDGEESEIPAEVKKIAPPPPSKAEINAAANKQAVIDLAAKHGLTLDPILTRREMEDALVAHLNGEDE